MLKFGMCQTGLVSVRQMSQVWHVSMASVHQMSQVWHVSMASVRQMSQVWHVPMASVRQMSQVWHVPMASIDMSQVFVTHATMLRDTSGFQWHMPKTCDISMNLVSHCRAACRTFGSD